MADHGDRVLCHACGGVSLKEDGRDLTCPHCESDFTEIIEIPPDTEDTEEPSTPSPLRSNPFANPLTDDDDDMFTTRWHRRPQSDIRGNPIGFMEPMFQESPRYSRHSYRSPDGRFTFTTTSIRGGASSNSFQQGNGYPNPTVPMMMQGLDSLFQALSDPRREERQAQMPHSPPRWNDDLHRGLDDYPDPEEQAPQDRSGRTASPPEGSLADFLASFSPDYDRTQRRQGAFGGTTGVAGPNPLAMLSALLNMNRNGDAVYSQAELDRVISQLIDQNAPGSAPPPASTTAIRSLPKKKIDQEMLGSDGNAECSICMDAVELGTEVTVLPCTHWFHFPCIEAWLTQHNTCPHCRRAIDINTNCRSVPRPMRPNTRVSATFSTLPTMRRQTLNQDELADPFRPTSTTGNGTSEDPVIIPDSPEATSSGRRRGRSSPFASLRGRSSFSRSNTNSSGPSSPTPDQNGNGTRRSSRSSRNSGNSRTEGQRSGVGGWFWSRFGGTNST